jgi:hypothetical protein
MDSSARLAALAPMVTLAMCGSIAVPSGAGATTIMECLIPWMAMHTRGGIAVGSDGNLWFAASKTPDALGTITPAGNINEFTAGWTDGPPSGLTLPGATRRRTRWWFATLVTSAAVAAPPGLLASWWQGSPRCV